MWMALRFTAFTPEHEEAAARDNRRSQPGPVIRDLPEDHEAQQSCADQLAIVEGGHNRRGSKLEGAHQAIVPKPSEEAQAREHQGIPKADRCLTKERQRYAGEHKASKSDVGDRGLRWIMSGQLARQKLVERGGKGSCDAQKR